MPHYQGTDQVRDNWSTSQHAWLVTREGRWDEQYFEWDLSSVQRSGDEARHNMHSVMDSNSASPIFTTQSMVIQAIGGHRLIICSNQFVKIHAARPGNILLSGKAKYRSGMRAGCWGVLRRWKCLSLTLYMYLNRRTQPVLFFFLFPN